MLESKLKSEFQSKFFAEWEAKTQSRIDFNQQLKEMDRMQASHFQNLEARRQRLAELYITEQEQWDKEIASLQETQEQRAERLSVAAFEMRKRREDARQEQVNRLKRQAFQANCDELRLARTELRAAQVSHERQMQRQWAAERRAEAEKADQWYVEQANRDGAAYAEEQAAAKSAQFEADTALRATLAQQIEEQERFRKRKLEAEAAEDAALQEHHQLLRQREKDKESRRQRETAEMFALNRAANLEQQQLRAQRAKEERVREEELVAELMRQIEEEKVEQAKVKQQAKERLERQRAMLERQMQMMAESESHLEQLWVEESRRQWAKREAQWAKERELRDQLLRQCFEERALQIQLKQELAQREKEEAAAEAARYKEELATIKAVDEARAANLREMQTANRAQLLAQIEYRRAHADNGDDAHRMERAAAEVAEREYRAAVDRELREIEGMRPPGHEKVQRRKRTLFA